MDVSTRARRLLPLRTVLLVTASFALVFGWVAGVTARSAAPADDLAAGISLRGEWRIDVSESDGSPVATHEFSNSVTPSGRGMIASLLAGTRITGAHRVELRGDDPPCLGNSGSPTGCSINSPDAGLVGNWVFRDALQISRATNPPRTVLEGTAVAQRNGSIEEVRSFLITCVSETDNVRCIQGTFSTEQLTTATLPDPIDVVEGQLLRVTVELSVE